MPMRGLSHIRRRDALLLEQVRRKLARALSEAGPSDREGATEQLLEFQASFSELHHRLAAMRRVDEARAGDRRVRSSLRAPRSRAAGVARCNRDGRPLSELAILWLRRRRAVRARVATLQVIDRATALFARSRQQCEDSLALIAESRALLGK